MDNLETEKMLIISIMFLTSFISKTMKTGWYMYHFSDMMYDTYNVMSDNQFLELLSRASIIFIMCLILFDDILILCS